LVTDSNTIIEPGPATGVSASSGPASVAEGISSV